MKHRQLGRGPQVSAIGLGCSGMSGDYGVLDDVESVKTVHRAIDLGVTMLDTSDAYGAGKNETLIGGAIQGRREGLIVASKFGNIRGPGGQRGGVNGKPDYVPVACDASLKRLQIDVIDLYYVHRIDADVPIEDTVGAMARLVDQGKVRHLGLCEAGPDTIRRAHATHPLAAVQMEYSLWTRDAEEAILPVLRELGISLVAYSPLGRGFLTASFKARTDLIEGDRRHAHPRFQEGNFEQNLSLLGASSNSPRTRAGRRPRWPSPGSSAKATTSSRSPAPKRRTWLEQNVAAVDLSLSDAELQSLRDTFPPGAAAGLRYPEFQLRKLGI